MKYEEIQRWREDVFNATHNGAPHPKPATFIYNATWPTIQDTDSEVLVDPAYVTQSVQQQKHPQYQKRGAGLDAHYGSTTSAWQPVIVAHGPTTSLSPSGRRLPEPGHTTDAAAADDDDHAGQLLDEDEDEDGGIDETDEDEMPLASALPVPASLAPASGAKFLERPVSQDASMLDSGVGASVQSQSRRSPRPSPPDYAAQLADVMDEAFHSPGLGTPHSGYAFPPLQ